MIKKIAVSYSGKDSTLALHKLLKEQSDQFQVATLLVTITKEYGRTSMHGVREELLDAQAASLDLPLHKAYMPKDCTCEEYSKLMEDTCLKLKEQGITAVAFGDTMLADVKAHREKMLAKVGMEGIFPIWGMDTTKVVEQVISLGYKAAIVCLDMDKLDESFAGQVLDGGFLQNLPDDIDPCGENGEYHTFVFDGPLFEHPIAYKLGEKKIVDDIKTGKPRFCFIDMIKKEK